MMSMNRWLRTILVSLIPAVVAALFTLCILVEPSGFGEVWLFAMAATSAAMVSGAFFWWLYVERIGAFRRGRYVLVGLTCGIVAHPLMWLIYFGTFWLFNFPHATNSLAKSLPTNSLIEALVNIGGITLAGLWFVGWATAAIGAVGGWLFSLAWKRCDLATQS